MQVQRCAHGCFYFFFLLITLFVFVFSSTAARAPTCTCRSGGSFFSITLYGSRSLTQGGRSWVCEGHPLKNRSCHFGANCSTGRKKQDRRPRSCVTSSNSALLSFYGDAARGRAGRKERRCGQSVMSKTALEDRELSRPGLTSAADRYPPPTPNRQALA